MLNIKILLFCWQLPSIPSPPRGWSRDLGFSLSFFSAMDTVEVESWSFIRQQIVCKIYFFSHQMGMQPLSTQVVDAVVNFYSAGAPYYNHSFQTLVIQMALAIHLAQFQ